MLNNNINLGFINGFSSLQSYLIVVLGFFFAFFSIADIAILKRRKKQNGRVKLLPFFFSLLFLTLFLFFILLIESKALDRYDDKFIKDISLAYDNYIITSLHMAVLIPLVICCALLLFPRKKLHKPVEHSEKPYAKKPADRKKVEEKTDKTREKADKKKGVIKSDKKHASDKKSQKELKGKKVARRQAQEELDIDNADREKGFVGTEDDDISESIVDDVKPSKGQARPTKEELQHSSSARTFFSRFKEDADDADDDSVEILETNDIFKELGNNENDVKDFIERALKKLKKHDTAD